MTKHVSRNVEKNNIHTHNRFETMAFCDSDSLGNSKFTHDIHMVVVIIVVFVVVVMTHTIDTLSVCLLLMYVPRAEKRKTFRK